VLDFSSTKEANMPDKNRLLELALKGLQAERAKLDVEISQIRSQLGLGRSSAHSSSLEDLSAPRKRRRMSAAAKRKISESMKRRYAEMRKGMRKAG
jgi:hypothetical protein